MVDLCMSVQSAATLSSGIFSSLFAAHLLLLQTLSMRWMRHIVRGSLGHLESKLSCTAARRETSFGFLMRNSTSFQNRLQNSYLYTASTASSSRLFLYFHFSHKNLISGTSGELAFRDWPHSNNSDVMFTVLIRSQAALLFLKLE